MASGIIDSSTFGSLAAVATHNPLDTSTKLSTLTTLSTTLSTLLSTTSIPFSSSVSNKNQSHPTIKDNSRFALSFDLNLGSIDLDLLNDDSDQPESFIKLAPILIAER